MAKVSKQDAINATNIRLGRHKGTRAELRNEVRCRFPAPTKAEVDAWNSANVKNKYLGDIARKYGERTGLTSNGS